MSNTEWLLLQVIGDAIVLWICWLVYPYLRAPDVDDGHDEHEHEHEHEDVDRARG